jgi:phage anti-repressor protein
MKAKHTSLATMAVILGVVTGASVSADDASKNDMTKNIVSTNCPVLTEQEVKTLAKDGKVEVNGKEFNLVSKNETGSDYRGHLIENKDTLSSFLDKSKSLVTVTRYINTHQSHVKKDRAKAPCAYNLEREKDIAVIAISPTAPKS